VIRRATSSDHPWIRSLAAEAYRELGDYRTIIGSWLEHRGVLTFVDEVDEPAGPRARGFILLGFYQPPDGGPGCIADLLAIAVAPADRRAGVGRALLGFAIALAAQGPDGRTVRELRLTVAEPNHIGRRLFESSGFAAVEEDHGSYDGGQRAIRMARGLPR
jgi:ribosomal protein S18 acetylase RimI-like enzyme